MTGYHDALVDCRLMQQMFSGMVEFLKQHQDVDISKYQAERIKKKDDKKMKRIRKFNQLSEGLKFGKNVVDDVDILYQDYDFFIKFDGYPTSPGHILIITNGNEETYFDLSDSKKNKLNEMLKKAKEIVESKYKPDGYNIGMNCGLSAGQTVMQFHCHLIPRYTGDVENPRGGVRHSVIGKGYY